MPMIWIDDESYGQLKRLAAVNHRKMAAELRMALEARLAGIVSQPNVTVTVEEAEGLSLMDTLAEEEDHASNPTMQADLKLLADRLIMHEEEVEHAE